MAKSPNGRGGGRGGKGKKNPKTIFKKDTPVRWRNQNQGAPSPRNWIKGGEGNAAGGGKKDTPKRENIKKRKRKQSGVSN